MRKHIEYNIFVVSVVCLFDQNVFGIERLCAKKRVFGILQNGPQNPPDLNPPDLTPLSKMWIGG